MRRFRWRAVVALAAAVALTAVACGGRDDEGSKEPTKKGAPATTAGFDGKTITLGVITPQTGIASIIGIPLTKGGEVFFKGLNAKGGIAGKYPVKLEIRDSQYNANTAQQNYSDLRNKVVMIEQILGTDVTNAVLKQMQADNMVASPATLDAEWVRDPNLLPVAAPYQIEAINGLSYWVTEGGGEGKTLCALASDDLYGEAGLDGVEFAQKDLDFKMGKVVRFAPDTSNFSSQVQQLSSGCDAVFLAALPNATLSLMGTAATSKLDVRWIGLAPTWVGLLASGATGSYLKDHFWLAAQGPEWGDVSVPGMKMMIEDQKKYAPDQKPDLYFAFGYAQAFTVAKLLEKAVERGDLSHKGIMDALNELGTVDTMGAAGSYTYGPPEDRKPPEETTIFSVDPAAADVGFLKAVKTNYISDAAKKFEFPK